MVIKTSVLVGLPAVLLYLVAAPVVVAAEVPAPCAGPKHHQFDFWLGEWEVRNNAPDATVVGSSRIERINGCTVLENWRGSGGTVGHSLNAYDSASGGWHQFWSGSDATVLHLQGGLIGTEMVLNGARRDPTTGVASVQRITWTPNADGSVRQHWESSSDGGAHWITAFDGVYRHRTSGG